MRGALSCVGPRAGAARRPPLGTAPQQQSAPPQQQNDDLRDNDQAVIKQ